MIKAILAVLAYIFMPIAIILIEGGKLVYGLFKHDSQK